MKIAAIMFFLLGCVAIGAWLVIQGHPWFGAVAMFIAATFSYNEK